MNRFSMLSISVLFLFCPDLAQANAGLPVIAWGEPLMLLMFVPVVLIESFVYWKKLGKGLKSSIWTSFRANLFTTLIGYPLSWILLLIYEFAINYALSGLGVDANLFPGADPTYFRIASIIVLTPAWIFPFAHIPLELTVCLLLMVGLIPAYYLSISEEHRIIQRIWGDNPHHKEACITANRITYSILYLVVIGIFFHYYFKI